MGKGTEESGRLLTPRISLKLKSAGFSKKGKNRYLKDNGLELVVELDRHGWDPEFGWGFHVRTYDMRGVDRSSYDMPKHATEIRPTTLVKEQLISQDDLRALYAQYLDSHPSLYGQVERSWFAFYDEEHLDQVLKRLLPLVATSVSSWFRSLSSE